jgi:hypothetical protein
VEGFVSPLEGLQLIGSGTVMNAELGAGTPDTLLVAGGPFPLESKLLAIAPNFIGNIAGLYSPRSVTGLQFKADWHYVGWRYSEDPLRRTAGTKLPAYNYFNFGVGLAIPNAGTRINLDLLNAFQSQGLEEGNPRLVAQGGSALFLARPLLPRRLQASVQYDFGGGPTH